MKPLPFVWPFSPLFWAAVLWAFWPEFAIIRRARRTKGTEDAKSLQVIMLGQRIASVLAFPLAWVPAFQFPAHRAAVFAVGVAVLTLRALLRRHCWRMHVCATMSSGARLKRHCRPHWPIREMVQD